MGQKNGKDGSGGAGQLCKSERTRYHFLCAWCQTLISFISEQEISQNVYAC